MSDEANHLSGFDGEVDALIHLPIAVAESSFAYFDFALYFIDMYGVRRFGDAGDVIQNIKNTFGSRGAFLRIGNNRTHRIQTPVKAPDVGLSVKRMAAVITIITISLAKSVRCKDK